MNLPEIESDIVVFGLILVSKSRFYCYEPPKLVSMIGICPTDLLHEQMSRGQKIAISAQAGQHPQNLREY